jgi:hypothetical protein
MIFHFACTEALAEKQQEGEQNSFFEQQSEMI